MDLALSTVTFCGLRANNTQLIHQHLAGSGDMACKRAIHIADGFQHHRVVERILRATLASFLGNHARLSQIPLDSGITRAFVGDVDYLHAVKRNARFEHLRHAVR